MFDSLTLRKNSIFPNLTYAMDEIANNLSSFAKYMKEGLHIWTPFNIIKEEDNITIELAVAGYSKELLSVSYKNGLLIVEGKQTLSKSKYLYKGISAKGFTFSFPFLTDYQVDTVNLTDGILSINLTKKPEMTETIQIN